MWTISLETQRLTECINRDLDVDIHATFRPLAVNKPLYRLDPVSNNKLTGEGKLEERKKILGWTVNCRKHTMELPQNKSVVWKT